MVSALSCFGTLMLINATLRRVEHLREAVFAMKSAHGIKGLPGLLAVLLPVNGYHWWDGFIITHDLPFSRSHSFHGTHSSLLLLCFTPISSSINNGCKFEVPFYSRHYTVGY